MCVLLTIHARLPVNSTLALGLPYHGIAVVDTTACGLCLARTLFVLCGFLHGIYHTIPYHTIHHTIPYHTIPYHTIPYHTIQVYSAFRIHPSRLRRELHFIWGTTDDSHQSRLSCRHVLLLYPIPTAPSHTPTCRAIRSWELILMLHAPGSNFSPFVARF